MNTPTFAAFESTFAPPNPTFAPMKPDSATAKPDSAPERGRRFLHRRWLDASRMPAHFPAMFQVTAIRHGAVYYRPVYRYENGTGGRVEVGKSKECCYADQWHRVCLRYATETEAANGQTQEEGK